MIEKLECEETPVREKSGFLYAFLSFLLPILIMGSVFALHKIYPFGGRQILVTDFWQQYYPFLSDYWHKLNEGSSLLWSWTSSGDYLGNVAYYMASPLNLLIAFVPHAWLREALTCALLIKLGFAGLFFSLYLQYTYRKRGPMLPAFASLYALCAFTQGYYWNIMWFDSFALLPLVMLGLQAVFREGKFLLYIAALAMSVLFNYLIGFFICLFVGMTFLGECITRRLGWDEFFRKLALIFVCSAIALGLTAWLTFPAYSSLQGTNSMESAFPSSMFFYQKFSDVMGNFIAFTRPTLFYGLPNLYCGMISVLLGAAFVSSPNIPLRERFVSICAVGFLILSCNQNVLDYIWHGFHFTTGMPFRFSFLISFALVVMAYRAYLLIENMQWPDIAIMGAAAAVFVFMAANGPQGKNAVTGSAVLCAVYLPALGLLIRKRGSARLLKCLLAVLMLAEVSASAYIGVKVNRTTDRASYPDKYAQVRQLLDMRRSDNPGFARTELTDWYTGNDASLFGFNGVSFFSSSLSDRTVRFMGGLGLPLREAGNRYYYAETSPLTNAFLNMRYLISRSGRPADGEVYWRQAGKADGALLLENNKYLPMGFMVANETAGYVHDSNPFKSQNDLFRRATGIDADLFSMLDASGEAHRNYVTSGDASGYSYSSGYSYRLKEGSKEGKLEWRYTMPRDGVLYAYFKIDSAQTLSVSSNGAASRNIRRPYLFTVGRFSRNEQITFSANLSAAKGSALIYAGCLNQDLFDRGYALLSEAKLKLTKFTDTEVAGTVTAPRDGLLYTSIPNEKRWRVFVDGVDAESEVTLIDGCMTAVRLSKGQHSVEFRYYNNSLTAGVIVSAVSLAALAALMLKYKRKL